MSQQRWLFVCLMCTAWLGIGGCSLFLLFAPTPAGLAGDQAFQDVTSRLGDAAAIAGWGGLAAFDYDNDGDIDLLVTNGPGTANRLFQNDGNANFTDVAAEAGLDRPDDNCMACGVGDFNNDGFLDLLVGRQLIGVPEGSDVGPVFMLNNGPNADGVFTFSEATSAVTGLTSSAAAAAIGIGDLNNDGLLDVLIGRYDMSKNGMLQVPIYETQPNELWRCTGVAGGIPTYTKETLAGIEGTPQRGMSPETQDDMFIPGTLVLYLTDVDHDGFLDIFDLHDIPGGIDYFRNNGDMTFTVQQADILNKHGGWMGMAGGDYDRDGDVDYFLTNVGCDFNTALLLPNTIASAHLLPDGALAHMLLRNDGGGTVSNITAATPVQHSAVLPPSNLNGLAGLEGTEFGFGATFIDSDNRGWLDLYWTGDLVAELAGIRGDSHGVARFLTNDGTGGFIDHTGERGLFNIPADGRIAYGQNDAGRALAACDLNGDGFRDLVCTNATMLGTPTASVRVFLNPGVPGNHWLTVRLRGAASNRFGIGARVEATIAGATLAAEVLSSTSAFMGLQPEAHFGVGSATTIDTLSVHWPSGATTTLNDVAVDQVLTVDE